MGIGFPNPILRLLPGITPKQETLGGTDVGVRLLCVDPVKRAVPSAEIGGPPERIPQWNPR
jgi:hypothetical protein